MNRGASFVTDVFPYVWSEGKPITYIAKYVYIYIYTHTCTYIYIYIYVEREKDMYTYNYTRIVSYIV